LEYLVYKGVHDLLLKEPIISESSDSMLHITLAILPTIESYFCECPSKNALVIKSKARCKTVVPKDNHLQELQDKEEKPQEGKVDEE
jgi:hypothetical protein